MPDEAYALRVRAIGGLGWLGASRVLYDPGTGPPAPAAEAQDVVFSRHDGVLSYKLAAASRVHVQAGQAGRDPETGVAEGPVLKTLVDRAPRTAGAVIEAWNGRDESDAWSVPDLPDFAVAILAMPLPENPLITVGNRKETFLDYARRKRPAAALEPRQLEGGQHTHHAGLNAFEDRSPVVRIEPQATFDAARRIWIADGDFDMRVTVDSSAAPYFLSQPNEVTVFVDALPVLRLRSPGETVELRVPASQLAPGERRVVVNWASQFGPVGVAAIKVVRESRRASREEDGR